MARSGGPPGGDGAKLAAERVGRFVRRAWPIVLAAYERWQALPEHKKEEYRRRARGAAETGKRRLDAARTQRGKRRR